MAKNIVPLQVRRTTFALGKIDFEGYTADEVRADGIFVNYLSGRGIATSIGKNESSMRYNRMPKGLKALLRDGSSMRRGVYKFPHGGSVKLNLWPTESTTNIYRYHAKKGNDQSLDIICALASASFDAILNEKFGRATQPHATLNAANRYFRETPKEWDLHFDGAWQKEACRCLKLNWQGQAMAKFIVNYVYRHLDIWDELKSLNQNPKRDRYHQYLTEVASEDIVKKHIHAVYMLLSQSLTRSEFKMNWKNYTNGVIQGRLI